MNAWINIEVLSNDEEITAINQMTQALGNIRARKYHKCQNSFHCRKTEHLVSGLFSAPIDFNINLV